MTEGLYTNYGIETSINSNMSGITIHSAPAVGLIGVRLKSSSLNQNISVVDYSTLCSTGGTQNYMYSLCINPIIGGTLTWSSSLSSSYEYVQGSAGNTVTSSGIVIDSGWISTNQKQSLADTSPSILQLGTSISGSIDQLWLTIYNLNTGTFFGTMNIQET
jgi:hypothetical protein